MSEEVCAGPYWAGEGFSCARLVGLYQKLTGKLLFRIKVQSGRVPPKEEQSLRKFARFWVRKREKNQNFVVQQKVVVPISRSAAWDPWDLTPLGPLGT